MKNKVSEVTSATRLAVEKAKADALFLSIGEGVIATDERGKIMKVNEAALNILGYDEEDLLEKWFLGAMPAYDSAGNLVEPFNRPILRALLEGKPITGTLEYAKKDGSRAPMAVTVSPIMLDGKPIGTIEVFRDITHEQEIDKAKTEFVSLASHQLRAPLTAIRWYLELFLNGEMGTLTNEQIKNLQEVYGVSLRLIDLVKALLSVARIELGTMVFATRPSKIEQFAKDVVFEQRPMITEKKLHFSEHYDPDLPLIPLDPDLTRVIFQNLLSNAVKYTPARGRISLKVTQDKKYALIEVTDTGCGIPKRQQKQLFTKLFRADNARKVDPEGTGLGLYIIRSIVNASGGKIWFTTEESKGTTFYVRLPLSGMPAGIQ